MTKGKVTRKSRTLKWVPLGKIKVNPSAQRPLKPARVDYLVNQFGPDLLGNPEVNERGGWFYVMDGQHRIEAVKRWLGPGWKDQQIECWVTKALSEEEEAENFLRLNDTLNVHLFDKFRAALQAGRQAETEVAAQAQAAGLRVSNQAGPGTVYCVGTLLKIHRRSGHENLRRTLVMARDAYGDSGLSAFVLDGLALACQRYNGVLDDAVAIEALGKVHGGVNGLLGKAEQIKQKTGNSKPHCVAAAAVEIINRRLPAKKKLAPWWKAAQQAD